MWARVMGRGRPGPPWLTIHLALCAVCWGRYPTEAAHGAGDGAGDGAARGPGRACAHPVRRCRTGQREAYVGMGGCGSGDDPRDLRDIHSAARTGTSCGLHTTKLRRVCGRLRQPPRRTSPWPPGRWYAHARPRPVRVCVGVLMVLG
jgi:hypothetical protein